MRIQKQGVRVRSAVMALVVLVVLGCTGWWVAGAETSPVLGTIDLSDAGSPTSVVVDQRSGRAIVTGFDPTIGVIDTHDGRLVRVLRVGGRNNRLAVDARTRHTFVVSMGGQGSPTRAPGAGQVTTLDTRSGTIVRTVTVGLQASAVAADERTEHVFVASIGATTRTGALRGLGRVSMVDAGSGALLGVSTVGFQPVAVAVAARTGRAFILNERGNSVSVLDTRTGAVIRTVPVGNSPLAVAVDETTGRVFVTNPGGWPAPGTVSVLDARTGAVLRTVTVGLSLDAVAVDERSGHVFVTGAQSVHMLDATSGSVLQTVSVGGSPFAVAVDSGAGRAFVTGTDGGIFAAIHRVAPGQPPEWAGYVAVFDTRSGALVRTVRVGRDPRGVAVDEGTGRVFVANAWGTSVSMVDARR